MKPSLSVRSAYALKDEAVCGVRDGDHDALNIVSNNVLDAARFSAMD
jgi:hypothetical protein